MIILENHTKPFSELTVLVDGELWGYMNHAVRGDLWYWICSGKYVWTQLDWYPISLL